MSSMDNITQPSPSESVHDSDFWGTGVCPPILMITSEIFYGNDCTYKGLKSTW